MESIWSRETEIPRRESLDGDTEAAIMESINSLHGKKTLVIIAHRLNTIEKCDIIYKVDEGKIRETKL